jgi:iron complex outermembrane receptor protein
MKFSHHSLAAAAIYAAISHTSNAQDALRTLQPLYVRSSGLSQTWTPTEHIIGSEHLRSVDAAAMVRNLPGAAIVRNGSQTGILQLRGLSGDRVGVRVDGMTITPACPNHMDPPLHYARPSRGDLVEMFAGISPVSAGGDQIGGSLLMKSAAPVFSEDSSILTQGALGAAFLGSQDAAMLNADLTLANANASVRYRGSAATADDLRYPGGTVSASGYDSTSHDLTGAWRTSGGYIAVDAGFSATRDAGTPALPMDMVKDDAWRFGLTQNETFDWGTLENRLYVHDIDHLMDNFTLRPVMPGAMAMEAPSSSRDFGWRGDVTLPRGGNKLRTGIDLHRNEFNAEQVARATGLRRDTFNDNRRSRIGAYADWEQKHSDQWSSRIGVRGDVVMSDADAVQNAILPPPGMMRNAILADQARFNAADRSFSDVLPAATAALRFEPDEQTGVELAMALKSRAPSLVERYLWTPLNASAGLADGRTYLGNLDLDPETSFQVALALTREGEQWNAGITPFYQSVNDYIQGMPIARNDMNGLPVLQYDNIDRAELYGFELVGGWRFNDAFALDGSVSYVRGRNKDTGGDLYRIAPLRGMLDLSYRRDSWESHLEWVWADAQNRVADLQNEQPTPGYGILNLRVAKTFSESIRIEIGVENLLDKRYADHLGGVNRVSGGDLAVGEQIPGAGRFAYVSLGWEF